jgi:heat shock transcription factor, other eukaryote
MYGFHKRVGLSDNSMRASERKNKSPSEYSNMYFRRGHPNLLWLINKAKGGTKTKKGKNADGDADSEDDAGADEGFAPSLGATTAPTSRALPPSDSRGPLQKTEITNLREELAKVRDQQNKILNVIMELRRNNDELYKKALMFQTQHDRHQHSINAILNFLANVFRKTLEDQGGAQNVNDLLSSIIPNTQVPQGGSIVDLGEFQPVVSPASSPLNVPKRARGLLPPIPSHGKASTVASPATTATPRPYTPAGVHNPEMGHVTELFDTPSEATSPNYLAQELESNPHESMMKIINDTNANSMAGIDLPDVVNNTTVNNMSTDQRNKMLHIMAQTASPASASTATPRQGSSGQMQPTAASMGIQDLSSNNPTQLSLANIMGSTPQPPSLQQIDFDKESLEALQKMQEEQAKNLDDLSQLLGPLSPSGRIPGLEETGNGSPYFDDNKFDMDQFINSNAFLHDGVQDFNNAQFATDGNDFNFNLDGTGAGGMGGGSSSNAGGVFDQGRVYDEGSTANNTPSPGGTEEISRDDFGQEDSPDRGIKRRRVG